MPACRRPAVRSGCFRNGSACVRPDPQAESMHRMALAAAEGRGLPQDWSAALDRLRQSAELGFALAQATLAGLTGDWPLSQRIASGEAVSTNWRALRDAIDLGAWKATPRPRIVSASPRVALVENMALPQTCDWLIE